MAFRPHRLILVAIGFAIVPAGIELLNTVRAGAQLAGLSAGELRWFDSSQPLETPWEVLLRSRWPILMLLTGIALLSPRSRWVVPMAWTYVIVVTTTLFGRLFLSNWTAVLLERRWVQTLPNSVCAVSSFLSFLLPQAVEVLPPLFLLIAAKALRGVATSPSAAPMATVTLPGSNGNGSSRLLGYHADRSNTHPSRWALRLAFAVACLANARLLCELFLAGGYVLTARREWGINTLPYYLFNDYAPMSIDAMSEYALRIGWVLILVGLWPKRGSVFLPKFVTAGVVAMATWAGLELLAVYLSDGSFVVAGHIATGAISAMRVEISEMAVMVMILAVLRSPLPASEAAQLTAAGTS